MPGLAGDVVEVRRRAPHHVSRYRRRRVHDAPHDLRESHAPGHCTIVIVFCVAAERTIASTAPSSGSTMSPLNRSRRIANRRPVADRVPWLGMPAEARSSGPGTVRVSPCYGPKALSRDALTRVRWSAELRRGRSSAEPPRSSERRETRARDFLLTLRTTGRAACACDCRRRAPRHRRLERGRSRSTARRARARSRLAPRRRRRRRGRLRRRSRLCGASEPGLIAPLAERTTALAAGGR